MRVHNETHRPEYDTLCMVYAKHCIAKARRNIKGECMGERERAYAREPMRGMRVSRGVFEKYRFNRIVCEPAIVVSPWMSCGLNRFYSKPHTQHLTAKSLLYFFVSFSFEQSKKKKAGNVFFSSLFLFFFFILLSFFALLCFTSFILPHEPKASVRILATKVWSWVLIFFFLIFAIFSIISTSEFRKKILRVPLCVCEL